MRHRLSTPVYIPKPMEMTYSARIQDRAFPMEHLPLHKLHAQKQQDGCFMKELMQ